MAPLLYRGAMDNDRVHKFAYRHRQMVADLLWLAAPAVAPVLDFAAAEELPTEGVRAGAGGLVQHRSDMAWCIPFKRGGQHGGGLGAGRPLLVMALEFQSTVHRRMGQRMRTYGTMLRQRVARRSESMPWLLPLVLYNGNDRWTAPGFIQDMPPLPSVAAERFLAPYQGWDYVLYSLERLRAQSSGTLAHLPLGNRVAATLRLQLVRTPEGVVRQFREEWARFPGPGETAIRSVLHTWAGALLADMGSSASVLPTLAQLERQSGSVEGEKNMATVSEVLAQEYRAKQQARGMALGIAQGVAQERARNLARLRRHAAIRFGLPTAQRLGELLGTAAATEQIERVSDWIIECERGEQLLARVSAMAADGGKSG